MRLTTRLQRITVECMDSDPDSVTYQTLKELGQQTEQAISRLTTEREHLDVPPAVGLEPDSVLALEQFVAEVRAGLEQASPADQARIYTMLRLRGQVRLASGHGVKLGRRHHFSIAWEGAVSVPDTGREYKKTRVKVLHP